MSILSRILKSQAGDDNYASVEEVENLCSSCIHRTDATNCTAFPDGIPLAILLGAFDHTHPYDVGGVNDHGIQYQPTEDKLS
jgi:hypothetical protein